ncbi:UvrD-helicase domain-containing protein [Labrenzia sp. R5_0]|uniref:UvrD-helicase domain-containing protein n=1 Tax=Labrenzia sp. R5_0 TaxID=2821108 RepID=UPI001ADC7842|nr:UvrD-helicase domain-containing protein [Labrenzia sp. R5_0]MBO9459227.1 UvrD-helicase domain-containing protein [Labrenzia sp. R5_0]
MPPYAFSGADGADPRLTILRNNTTLDVEACPGSGKTTLLVAKLAILARYWSSRDQGICVLSHTNAARREIEKKLGRTSEGQRLLSYPHFVGTIHGFVNEYLALPWLRSKGVKVKAIDDELSLDWRWNRIPHGSRYAIEQRRMGANVARYIDANHTPKDFGFRENTATYQQVRDACAASTEAGLFCHEEMFVWASEFLAVHPEVAASIRCRFPILFIDEVQDNSELQTQLLHKVFIEGDVPVIRQRFGDQNQSIYDYSGEEGAVTDTFPHGPIARTIPNSHRFGQSIADLANPLAIVPQGLVGQGGLGLNGEEELAGQHVMLLFEEADIEQILPGYAHVLRETFAPEELAAGDFTAVAAVHATDAADHVPRSVRHYWTSYDPDIARSDPQPKKMVQFIRAAQRITKATGEHTEAVDAFAKGILKLARFMNDDATITIRRFKHRYVIELLDGDKARIDLYQELVTRLVIDGNEPTQAEWEGGISASLSDLAIAISGAAREMPQATRFLEWMEAGDNPGDEPSPINVVYDRTQEPPITVRLGSIHSVKGETHTATLVLESYNRTHHLHALKRWLLGSRNGGAGQNAAMHRRLKLHYVAMTRPQRLLCLAMRADSWSQGEIGTLKARGWRVARVANGETNFL